MNKQDEPACALDKNCPPPPNKCFMYISQDLQISPSIQSWPNRYSLNRLLRMVLYKVVLS